MKGRFKNMFIGADHLITSSFRFELHSNFTILFLRTNCRPSIEGSKQTMPLQPLESCETFMQGIIFSGKTWISGVVLFQSLAVQKCHCSGLPG